MHTLDLVTARRLSLIAYSGLASAVFLLAVHAHAAVQTSITIEQVSPGTVGEWTLLFGDGSWVASTGTGVNAASHSLSVTDFGPMTFSVTLPPGMAVRINIYRNGELLRTETTPQFSFTPYPNETYRFLAQYSYSLLGTLGVTSEPSRMRFRMKGPTHRTYVKVTPFTFKNLPAGKYTLLFSPTKECTQPAPQNAAVKPEERNTISVKLNCEKEEVVEIDRSRPTKRSLVEAVFTREHKPRGERK